MIDTEKTTNLPEKVDGVCLDLPENNPIVELAMILTKLDNVSVLPNSFLFYLFSKISYKNAKIICEPIIVNHISVET